MPTKIRLQRKGKKGQPFYHLVVADGRAPRDGKFIERLGTYNPMTLPATIELNFDRALYWVQVGAQPSDTARSILSNQGVLLKHHLIKGVAKGALTEEQVEEKFEAWQKEKIEKLAKTARDKELSQTELEKKRLEEERKINEAKAEELAKKRAKASLKSEEAGVAETPAAEAKEEAAPEKEKEAPAAEAKEEAAPEKEKEAPAAEAKEEPAPEKEKEAPAAEAKEEPAPEEKTEDKKETGKKSE
ncbi:MAG: 30S ribosomal protein S16 [Bacteroidales bacterium]